MGLSLQDLPSLLLLTYAYVAPALPELTVDQIDQVGADLRKFAPA